MQVLACHFLQLAGYEGKRVQIISLLINPSFLEPKDLDSQKGSDSEED